MAVLICASFDGLWTRIQTSSGYIFFNWSWSWFCNVKAIVVATFFKEKACEVSRPFRKLSNNPYMLAGYLADIIESVVFIWNKYCKTHKLFLRNIKSTRQGQIKWNSIAQSLKCFLSNQVSKVWNECL